MEREKMENGEGMKMGSVIVSKHKMQIDRENAIG